MGCTIIVHVGWIERAAALQSALLTLSVVVPTHIFFAVWTLHFAPHAEIGHRSASLGHLVTLSYKLGQTLNWDPAKEEFADNEAANRLRTRAMRAPWQI